MARYFSHKRPGKGVSSQRVRCQSVPLLISCVGGGLYKAYDRPPSYRITIRWRLTKYDDFNAYLEQRAYAAQYIPAGKITQRPLKKGAHVPGVPFWVNDDYITPSVFHLDTW